MHHHHSTPPSNVQSPQSSKSKPSLAILAQSSIYGAVRTLIGMPFEHPLDTIKTTSQAFPKLSLTRSVAHIYNTRGLAQGLYAGLIPNASRVIVKQAYRFPMMIALPPVLSSVTSNTSAQRLFSGILIASFESFIVCPLERLKVQLQTMKPHAAISNSSASGISTHSSSGRLISLLSTMPMSELFRGLNAVLARSLVSWCTFLVSEHKVSQYVYKNYYERNTWQSILMISALVGAINTFIVLPFDVVKTQMQKDKMHHLEETHSAATSNNKNSIRAEKEGIVQVMKHLVEQNKGMGVLFKGWQPRFLQYLIQAMFTTNLLHYYDDENLKNREKKQEKM